jgi:hypothetical protein
LEQAILPLGYPWVGLSKNDSGMYKLPFPTMRNQMAEAEMILEAAWWKVRVKM